MCLVPVKMVRTLMEYGLQLQGKMLTAMFHAPVQVSAKYCSETESVKKPLEQLFLELPNIYLSRDIKSFSELYEQWLNINISLSNVKSKVKLSP
jgi:hypothetical protein